MTDIDSCQALAARVMGCPAPMWTGEQLAPGLVRLLVLVEDGAPEFLAQFRGRAWIFTRDETARAGWRWEEERATQVSDGRTRPATPEPQTPPS